MPNRKSNPIDAPKTSKSFPGLTAKRFGSGGLNPGGAVNTEAPVSSLDLVDTETESEDSEDALTIIMVRIDLLRDEETDRIIGGCGRMLFTTIPAIDFFFLLLTFFF